MSQSSKKNNSQKKYQNNRSYETYKKLYKETASKIEMLEPMLKKRDYIRLKERAKSMGVSNNIARTIVSSQHSSKRRVEATYRAFNRELKRIKEKNQKGRELSFEEQKFIKDYEMIDKKNYKLKMGRILQAMRDYKGKDEYNLLFLPDSPIEEIRSVPKYVKGYSDIIKKKS